MNIFITDDDMCTRCPRTCCVSADLLTYNAGWGGGRWRASAHPGRKPLAESGPTIRFSCTECPSAPAHDGIAGSSNQVCGARCSRWVSVSCVCRRSATACESALDSKPVQTAKRLAAGPWRPAGTGLCPLHVRFICSLYRFREYFAAIRPLRKPASCFWFAADWSVSVPGSQAVSSAHCTVRLFQIAGGVGTPFGCSTKSDADNINSLLTDHCIWPVKRTNIFRLGL